MRNVCMGIVFFFKQKTAYEMRISDWSSDVCSSDLARLRLLGTTAPTARGLRSQRPRNSRLRRNGAKRVDTADMRIVRRRLTSRSDCLLPDLAAVAAGRLPDDAATPEASKAPVVRSEERRVGKECGSECRSRWAS